MRGQGLTKDQLIERLREELTKRAFHKGDGEFTDIYYCDFCGYSRSWITNHSHGDTCILQVKADE